MLILFTELPTDCINILIAFFMSNTYRENAPLCNTELLHHRHQYFPNAELPPRRVLSMQKKIKMAIV